jgi:hypothetical protein
MNENIGGISDGKTSSCFLNSQSIQYPYFCKSWKQINKNTTNLMMKLKQFVSNCLKDRWFL